MLVAVVSAWRRRDRVELSQCGAGGLLKARAPSLWRTKSQEQEWNKSQEHEGKDVKLLLTWSSPCRMGMRMARQFQFGVLRSRAPAEA